MNEFKLESEEIEDLKLTIDTLRDYLTEANEEIERLNKIIEKLENYNELVYKRYDRKIKDYPVRSIVKHNLEIIKELKEEGK